MVKNCKSILIIVCCQLSGCASSVYEEVADEIIAPSLNNPVNYGIAWQSYGRTAGDIVPPETYQTFLDTLNSCAEKLEKAKLEFMGTQNPSKPIATIQLMDCMNANNFKIEVTEEILIN